MSRSPEQDALVPILERLGVPRDGVLVVHTAIAKLSRKGFRAEAMIEALLDYLRGGTLVMPVMTWRTVTPKTPEWNELTTASETGVMTEIFRTRYATARSIHPTHSAAGFGPAAAHLLSRHHIDNTPVSANSPYGLMRDYSAYVLTLGVGLETCTAIHLPEETVATDVYLRPLDTAFTYPCTDRHGTVHPVRVRLHWRLDRDFPQFAGPLAAKGELVTGRIEDCDYTLVRLSALLDEVMATLKRNKYGTLRQPHDAAASS